MNTLILPEVAVSTIPATSQYWDGFYSYMEDVAYDVMTTAQQQRGWMAALASEAEAMTPCIEDDYEWIRQGC